MLWRNLYQFAILETDPTAISLRIAAARQAMNARLRSLADAPDAPKERHQIAFALAELGSLERRSLRPKPRRFAGAA
jgi:hypothetical protein